MSVSVLTIFALPNIFLARRSPGPSTATFSFAGGGTFIKTPVNSAVRRSREAPTTGRGLRFIQCYSTGQSRSMDRERNVPCFSAISMELRIPVSGDVFVGTRVGGGISEAEERFQMYGDRSTLRKRNGNQCFRIFLFFF